MFKTVLKCTKQPFRYSYYSTAVQPNTADQKLSSFRTLETNPVNHTLSHEAQFYKLDPNDKKQLFTHGGIPKSFEIQCKTFNETCIMVRKPALDIVNCIKHLDLSKPVVRFVLYGKKGSGKSLTLAHVTHYALKEDYLIVHVPWVGNWMRRCKEYSNSETKEGFVDLNLDAAAWLANFKTQNAHLLNKKSDLKLGEDYQWTKRETTLKDAPLIELIEHGINRVKFASDTVTILSREVKRLSNIGVCKTYVAIDGFNALFYPNTNVFTSKKEKVHPHNVSLATGFLNLTKYNWQNAVVVVTVDELAIAEEDHISHMPKYLLGKDGFEHMDPFVPIFVPDYSKKELHSCMEYFRERKWVAPHDGQDEEFAFLSSNNPYRLMQICAPV